MQLAGEVRATVVEEVRARQRRLEPLRPGLHRVVEVRESPGRPALEPDGFVRIEQLAAATEGGVDAAVLAVEAVLEPERDHVLQETVAVGADQLVAALGEVRGHGRDGGKVRPEVNAGRAYRGTAAS